MDVDRAFPVDLGKVIGQLSDQERIVTNLNRAGFSDSLIGESQDHACMISLWMDAQDFLTMLLHCHQWNQN